MALFKKDHVFPGPEGASYRATHDLEPGAVVYPQDLEPQGGAPIPQKGEFLPHWLAKQLWPDRYE